MIGDFSENYSFVVPDKAQLFHLNNGMAIIHPFVYYYRNACDIKHGNWSIISLQLIPMVDALVLAYL